MKISYNWLQTYFKDKLPAPSKVAEAFTFGAFEIENVESVGNVAGAGIDSVLDLKVLPDRACYALSHRGAAYELSAITGQKSTVDFAGTEFDVEKITLDEVVSVIIEDKKLCQGYLARRINNVTVESSPLWLGERLGAVGQRAINNIVDATNYVMLDIGQPLHAFDADKIKGGIHVRLAKDDETIELLPEKGGLILSRNVTLLNTDLIIADDQGPIAIAGVKGGLRAGVTASTKNLIIESANFEPVSVRRTSTRLALRNEASKRFENGLAIELAKRAIEEVSMIIKNMCPGALIGPVDDKSVKPKKPKTISVSAEFISDRLDATLKESELEDIFARLQIGFQKKTKSYVLNVPLLRLDLNLPEDIVEEVGRIYGYDKIAPAIPQKVSTAPAVNQLAYWTEKIKDVLYKHGFSEVQTYSLVAKSQTEAPDPVEIQNPLASDKNFLRDNLHGGLLKALEQNGKNAALLGTDEIKIFEVGTVFDQSGERLSLGIGAFIAKNIKKKDQETALILDKVVQAISKAIGVDVRVHKTATEAGQINEINLSEIISTLKKAKDWDIKCFGGETKYVPFSVFPTAARIIGLRISETLIACGLMAAV